MIKTILSTLILATISLTASAEYIIKVPLEVAQGGTLPNGSINFVSVPVAPVVPAPTLVSSENVCEDSATYDAATLYVTQTRNYTRTCKDVALYSDNSTVESNETVDNLSVTGVRNHFPYFTTIVNYRLSGASFNDTGVNKLYQLTSATGILSTQHKSMFRQLWLRGRNLTNPDTGDIVNTMENFTFIISGNRASYQNSIKTINITTNTNVKDIDGNVVSCRPDSIVFSYASETGNTTISCIFNKIVTDANTHFNSATVGTIEFVLVD